MVSISFTSFSCTCSKSLFLTILSANVIACLFVIKYNALYVNVYGFNRYIRLFVNFFLYLMLHSKCQIRNSDSMFNKDIKIDGSPCFIHRYMHPVSAFHANGLGNGI